MAYYVDFYGYYVGNKITQILKFTLATKDNSILTI